MRADDFAELARHWRGIADDELSKLDAAEIHERRNLHVHQSLFGMGVLEGDLDAEGTEILLTALDHAAPPDATGGPVPARSLAQRRADALVDICSGYLSGTGEGTVPVEPERHHGPRHPHRCAAGGSPSGALRARRLRPHPARDRVPVGVRLLGHPGGRCAATPKSSTSAAPPASRQPRTHKALAIRDRGCVFPGCDRPPAWCNAHHLVWWEHGGPTDEQNLCLLCRRHHTLCHEGGWGIPRRDDGTYEVHEPPAGHIPTRRHGRAPPTAV